MSPDWLPPELIFKGSSLEADYKMLYKVFERDFINSPPLIVDGCTVVVNNRPDPAIMNGTYTYGLTHLVTSGENERFIDYNRAAKLPWVRPIIDNYTAAEVTAFCVEQKQGETIYLWLADSDFVVVLRALNSRRERMANPKKIIVTAYDVYPSGRYKLQRLYGRSTRQL